MGYYDSDYRRFEREDALEAANEILIKLLSDLCRSVSPHYSTLMPDDVLEWWVEYQKQEDTAREAAQKVKAKEAAKQSGLAKLTPEERQALGL